MGSVVGNIIATDADEGQAVSDGNDKDPMESSARIIIGTGRLLNTNTWYNITITFKDSNDIEFYIDGVFVSESMPDSLIL
jgi:hypothetical protein